MGTPPVDSQPIYTHYSHSSVACSAFDLQHVKSWGKIMTDLCLTLAILTGGELSLILKLTFGIFALWRILLTQLKMLTRMTIGSELNDWRQWLPYEGLSLVKNRFDKAKHFSTFDIRDAFQTIKLTEESSILTTTHTPWGHYQWIRLPFGVSSAPEEFQWCLHNVIRDMEGVLNIANDIIVIGRRDSIDQAALDHDKTVLELLRRLTSHNLKLNPDKTRFKSQSAAFMGHVLTSDGLKPVLRYRRLYSICNQKTKLLHVVFLAP